MRNEPLTHLRGMRVASGVQRQPLDLAPRPAWMLDERRACSPEQGDTDLFTSDDKKELAKAAKLCRARCPFANECLTYAIERGEEFNVWGGWIFSQEAVRQRARAERARRQPGAAPIRAVHPPQAPSRRLPDEFYQQVRDLYALDLPDTVIALRTGRHPSTVTSARQRMDLPSKFGPGGRRLIAAVAS